MFLQEIYFLSLCQSSSVPRKSSLIKNSPGVNQWILLTHDNQMIPSSAADVIRLLLSVVRHTCRDNQAVASVSSKTGADDPLPMLFTVMGEWVEFNHNGNTWHSRCPLHELAIT